MSLCPGRSAARSPGMMSVPLRRWDGPVSATGISCGRPLQASTLRHLHALATRTGHLERFLIFGSFVTNKELPGDVDVVLVMADAFKLEEAPRESRTLFSHAEADAPLRSQSVLRTARNPA